MVSCHECGQGRAVKKIEQYPKDYQHAGKSELQERKERGGRRQVDKGEQAGALSWKRSGQVSERWQLVR